MGKMKSRVTRAFLVLGCSPLLLACGGGGGSEGASPVQQNPNVINGVSVPPDPGAAGLTTVAGTDVDGNGIRDDIDRLLASKFGATPVLLDAGRRSATGLQRLLTLDPSSRSAVVTAFQDNGDIGVCVGRVFRAAGRSSSIELNEIYARTVNTEARIQKMRAISDKAGLFTRATTVECK